MTLTSRDLRLGMRCPGPRRESGPGQARSANQEQVWSEKTNHRSGVIFGEIASYRGCSANETDDQFGCLKQ